MSLEPSVVELSELRPKHRARLDQAIHALSARGYHTAYPDDPRDPVYSGGCRAAGEAAARARVDALASTTGAIVGSERSVLGTDWPTRYPDEPVATVVQRAVDAMPSWNALHFEDRAAVCMEILDALLGHAFEMAYACMHTCGQPFLMAFQAGTANALDRALEAIACTAREMRALPDRVLWEKPGDKAPVRIEKTYDILPRGVAAVVGCSTFPTWNSYPGLFASLAAGNPVIVKPHPAAVLPLSLFTEVARRVLADAGIDPDTVQLLVDTRDAPKTQALVTDARVRLVDFTGSSEFGEWIERHATQASVFTEKSGVNVAVLESTADYPGMVRNLAIALSLYSGQMCTTPQNIYVPAQGIGTPEGVRSVDAFKADLARAIGKLVEPARAYDLLGVLQSDATRARLLALSAASDLVETVVASRTIPLPEHPAAQVCTPAVYGTRDPQHRALGVEQFGPISFVVAVADREEALRAAGAVAQRRGAITWLVHSTDEAYVDAAKAAAALAGVHLTLNMTGPVLVNQSAAFSDFHVSGYNAAGNASLCDSAFVLPRFRVLQTRRYIA